MVVDDHDLVREGLRHLLESEPGWQVVGECQRAGDCLEALARCSPDLVLVDLNLPDGSGLELLGQIQERFAKVPTLVLSSSEEIDTVVKAMRAGASGYLVKSARREEMISAVRTVADGGAYLHPRVAPAVLLQLREGPARKNSETALTSREHGVVRHVSQGLSNAEIAELLMVSLGTVKNDLTLIFRKLGVRDRTQLIAEAARRGLEFLPP